LPAPGGQDIFAMEEAWDTSFVVLVVASASARVGVSADHKSVPVPRRTLRRISSVRPRSGSIRTPAWRCRRPQHAALRRPARSAPGHAGRYGNEKPGGAIRERSCILRRAKFSRTAIVTGTARGRPRLPAPRTPCHLDAADPRSTPASSAPDPPACSPPPQSR